MKLQRDRVCVCVAIKSLQENKRVGEEEKTRGGGEKSGKQEVGISC